MKPKLLNACVLIVPALLLVACGDNSDRTQPPAAAALKPAPTAAVATPPPSPVGIQPVDVPPGFDYPGDRAQFQAWADGWEIAQITRTAWDLWAGMTADSGQSWQGASLPVWETWCGTEEVFGSGCKPLQRPARSFKRAVQLDHMMLKAGQTVAPDTQVVSFNKFNPPMADYLAQQHAGPGAASYQYTSMKSLVALNEAWPADTPSADRKVQESPYVPADAGNPGHSAIETKPVIFVVKATGLTPMPLWQGPAGAAPGKQHNAVPESWLTCVLLDPANKAGSATAPAPASAEQLAQAVPNPKLSCQTFLYAPLSTIYSFKLSGEEAAAYNSAQGEPGITAAAGDYAVLAAMHVNSKTIVNWTWQTFWWQPGTDTPNNFPGSKQGMTERVQGAWRNYASCTAWNQTKGNASADMVVCFNPFLETSTGIPAGQTSNCMSCHGTATVGPAQLQANSSPPPAQINTVSTLNYPPAYDKPIDFGNDPMFSGFTRTDFSWAIPGDARDDLPQPSQ